MLKQLGIAAVLSVGMSQAGAALHERGGGMIYDDVLDITWLKDANYAQTSNHDADGRMTWTNAVAWADDLVYGGYSDWRLPTTNTGPTSNCSSNFNPGGGFPQQYFGFNCTGSEMGHMFYNNMGATSGSSILSGSNAANLALFTNVQSGVYWSGTEYAPDTSNAWVFNAPFGGSQGSVSKPNEFYAWAVRPGDVGRAPEPGSLALLGLGLGLMGLGYARGRR